MSALERIGKTEAVYHHELYEEMRRFRDYELRAATWYTTILVVIIGFLVRQQIVLGGVELDTAGGAPNLAGAATAVVALSIIAALGFASCLSVWHASQRYHQLRDLTNELEPTWKRDLVTKHIKPSSFEPHLMILLVQVVLVIGGWIMVLAVICN
jgi:hypothetical protein